MTRGQSNVVAQTAEQTQTGQSAVKSLAERLGVEATSLFLSSLRNVAFKQPDVSNEQLLALVVVSNQYKLNPFTKEIYAFPDRNSGGIVPVVSIDGWLRIINEQPQLDGLQYEELYDGDGKLIGGKCTIHRKDRAYPTIIAEALLEVKRNTDPWKTMQSRMLRHKTIIQCSRVAFGFAGIYEQDEAERIVDAQRTVHQGTPGAGGSEGVRALLDSAIEVKAEEPVTEEAAGADKDDGPPWEESPV